MKNLVRLQKHLAECQISSRRKCEQYIIEGKVKVNGEVVKELGAKVNPKKDKIEFNGKKVKKIKKLTYIMLHKPEGCVTTNKDEFGRKTVFDYVDIDLKEIRLFSVGRLDYDTSGLLLLTNDGDLAYKLTHPKHQIEKVYYAKILGVPSKNKISKFENGLEIDGYKTAPAKLEIHKTKNKFCYVKIILKEGKNRQVRKMCSIIGNPVISLKRVKLGQIDLGNLKKGNYRHLKKEELKYLKSII